MNFLKRIFDLNAPISISGKLNMENSIFKNAKIIVYFLNGVRIAQK